MRKGCTSGFGVALTTATRVSSCPSLTLNSRPGSSFGFRSSAEISSSKGRISKSESPRLGWLRNEINEIKSLDDARNVYSNMVRMRPLPNVIQFNQLLARVVSMKNYSTVIAFYRDMCFRRIQVSVHTMGMVINCYCLEGCIDLGFATLGASFKRGLEPNVITFNTLLKGYFRLHRVSEAQELFRKIIGEKLCPPNEMMIGIIIDGLSKAGNTGKSIEFLKIMENKDMKLDCVQYNSIIDALINDMMMDQALDLFHEIIEKRIAPTVVTYSCLIRGFCNLRKWDEVKRFWAEMTRFGITPNAVTYNILIDSYCKEGRMKDAEGMLENMIQRGETPIIITYNTMMEGYCLQGQVDKAKSIFDNMVSGGIVPDIVSFNVLINGYSKQRKFKEAMHLFLEIQCKGVTLNTRSYDVILKGLFQSVKCDAAKELFGTMKLVPLKPSFFTDCVMLKNFLGR